jgi:hypothetical protein
VIVKVPMGVKVGPVAALAAALRDLVGAEVTKVDEQDGQTRIVVEVIDQRYEFNAIWVGHGWPSEVREALNRSEGASSAAVVHTARRFSPGAISILKSRNANYADASGQARIVVPPGLVIVRESARQVEPEAPQSVRWSRSSIQIAELVLHEGLTELHTGKLAHRTEWSAAQVSKVLKMFDELGWTEQRGGKAGRGAHRELVAPGPLLDSWSEHVSQERRHKELGHRTTKDLLRFAQMELADHLGRDREDWALTTWAGLELTAPFATMVPILHIYISKTRFDMEVDELMRTSGIRKVDEGARIEFWEADFPLIVQSGQPPAGVPVASTPRLYADLLALGGRAADAAQHLRETKLGF